METKEVQNVEVVSHKNIYEAVSAFQGELKPIERSAKVKFKMKNREEYIDFNYAPLEKIAEVIYPLLAKHGLSYRHQISAEGIECILTHGTYSVEAGEPTVKKTSYAGGQVEEIQTPNNIKSNVIRSGVLAIDLKNPDMKEVGGQITYGRRYTLGLVLGLATEEDKDAQLLNEESNKNTKKFAFEKAKESIEKSTKKTIATQISFLEGELATAKAVADGNGKKAPALGLSVEEYTVLVKMAQEKLQALESGKDENDGKDDKKDNG